MRVYGSTGDSFWPAARHMCPCVRVGRMMSRRRRAGLARQPYPRGNLARRGRVRVFLALEHARARPLDHLCRGGVCGFCQTRVLELDGEIVHNDHYLSEASTGASS